MNTAKNAAASAKEAAANVAASAKSGMDKTKATTQEKAERMTTRNPVEKAMATEKKHEKIEEAELNKQAQKDHNAAAKHHTAAATGHVTGGTGGAANFAHGAGGNYK